MTHLLYSGATPTSSRPSQATPLELLAIGTLSAALGISALVLRARLWEIQQGMTRPMGPAISRFYYFISCLLVPAIFAVMGFLALVTGIVRI